MLNAPFTATILETLSETLDDRTRTGARVLAWPGDPMADALTLRLAGGLHALARAGSDDALSRLYATGDGDFAAILPRVLRDHDDWLFPWLDSPPQTNEVGRSGALMAGLMVASAQLKMPLELLELGASAGLNLNMDRFRFDLGGLHVGPADAGVVIAPDWDGPTPSGQWPAIAARTGVDQNPLNVADPAIAARLKAYCWPDQPDRLARLEAAIATACAHTVTVEAGDAGAWIEQQLAMSQCAGQARIVYHSVFWQYPPEATRQRIEAAILAAAASATLERPLGWLRFEPDPPAIAPMQLRLRIWPEGGDQHLAICHPHGTRIKWLGGNSG